MMDISNINCKIVLAEKRQKNINYKRFYNNTVAIFKDPEYNNDAYRKKMAEEHLRMLDEIIEIRAYKKVSGK